MSSATTITLTRQIVVLIGRAGVISEADLLTQLQTSFPTEGWTEAILAEYLSRGIRQGRFCLSNGQYALRADMVIVNNSNWVYQDLSSSITKRVNGTMTTTSSHDAPFSGNEECCANRPF